MSYDTRLREARKRAGLTQEELGNLSGVQKQLLQDMKPVKASLI